MKTPEPIIEELIARQLDGAPLTDAERRELQKWLEASEANRRAFLRTYEAWGEARLSQTRIDTGQTLENVMARIAREAKPRPMLRPQLGRLGIGIAAAACVALAVSVITDCKIRTISLFQCPDLGQVPPQGKLVPQGMGTKKQDPERSCHSFYPARRYLPVMRQYLS